MKETMFVGFESKRIKNSPGEILAVTVRNNNGETLSINEIDKDMMSSLVTMIENSSFDLSCFSFLIFPKDVKNSKDSDKKTIEKEDITTKLTMSKENGIKYIKNKLKDRKSIEIEITNDILSMEGELLKTGTTVYIEQYWHDNIFKVFYIDEIGNENLVPVDLDRYWCNFIIKKEE